MHSFGITVETLAIDLACIQTSCGPGSYAGGFLELAATLLESLYLLSYIHICVEGRRAMTNMKFQHIQTQQIVAVHILLQCCGVKHL